MEPNTAPTPPKGLPPVTTLQNEAYLISRGVRPAALLGSVPLAEADNTFIYLRQYYHTFWPAALPFVIPRTDFPCAMAGFAAAPWVIGLLTWSYAHAPMRSHHCILGLILGYSPAAIQAHDDQEYVGSPTAQPMSTRPLDRRTGKE